MGTKRITDAVQNATESIEVHRVTMTGSRNF